MVLGRLFAKVDAFDMSIQAFFGCENLGALVTLMHNFWFGSLIVVMFALEVSQQFVSEFKHLPTLFTHYVFFQRFLRLMCFLMSFQIAPEKSFATHSAGMGDGGEFEPLGRDVVFV